MMCAKQQKTLSRVRVFTVTKDRDLWKERGEWIGIKKEGKTCSGNQESDDDDSN